jgi:GNAT superfamily N-acetyltransferase
MTATGNDRHVQLFDQESPNVAELLREFHDKVLAPSFRPAEYVPPTTIDPEGTLALIACGDDGMVIGGALGDVFPDSGALLLGYLAVRPGLRGMGTGSVLLAALKERWLPQHPLAFLELDDPRHHETHPTYGDPARRLSFYGTFGIRLLTIPYFQPRLRNDLPRGYHMLLGVIPPDGATLPSTMPAGQVTAFLREYFIACEGNGTLDDAEVRWLLDAAGQQEEITLVGTEEYSRAPDAGPPDGRLPHHRAPASAGPIFIISQQQAVTSVSSHSVYYPGMRVAR